MKKNGYAVINVLCGVSLITGTGTCLVAQIAPSVPDLKGWSTESLMTLICLASLALAWFVVVNLTKRMDKMITLMSRRPCMFTMHEVAEKSDIEKEE